MTVKRAKKQKKNIPKENEQRMIMNATWLALSCTAIYPGQAVKWGRKAFETLQDAYHAVMSNIHDDSVKRVRIGLPAISPFDVAGIADASNPLHIKRTIGLMFAHNPYKASCNLLTASAMKLALEKLGWSSARIKRWWEGYVAMLSEVENSEQPTTAKDIYKWAEELTGMRVDEVITWN